MYTKNLWKIPLYQKSQDKSRGITTPWDWFGRDLGNLTLHGFARDGTRISRDLPNFSQDLVVCTDGTGIKKKKPGRDRDPEHFFFYGFGRERDFQNSKGSRDYPASRGIPRYFHNGKHSKENPVYHFCGTAGVPQSLDYTCMYGGSD